MNTYTCINSTGTITGLTSETSGIINIEFQLENSAGSANGHTTDGVYSFNTPFDEANIELIGYTGIITVLSVRKLTTKTQRQEQRILNHGVTPYGTDIVDNSDFNSDTDWTYGTGATGRVSIHDGVLDYSTAETIVDMTQTLDGVYDKNYVNIKFDTFEQGEFDILLGTDGDKSSNYTTLDSMGSTGFFTFYLDNSGSDNILTLRGQDFIGTISSIEIIGANANNGYYIDGDYQDDYALPEGALNLNNQAVIGYKDTITERQRDFRVYNRTLSLKEIRTISFSENVCITEVSDDGTWYGFEAPSFGKADPYSTIDTTTLHSLKWDANGEFIMSFGEDGLEQLTLVDEIVLVHPNTPDAIVLIWNDSNYTNADTPDAELSLSLIADYNLGVKYMCFLTEITPDVVLDYDFSTLLVGGEPYA